MSIENGLASVGAAAAIADSALTYIGLRWLGTREGSEAVVRMIRAFGLGPGLVLRTIVAIGLIAIALKVVTIPELRVFGLIVVMLLNVGVVGWNIHIMWG